MVRKIQRKKTATERLHQSRVNFWQCKHVIFSKIMSYVFFAYKKQTFFIFLLWCQRGPQVSEISASNKSGKIGLYEVRAQKSATFDPQNLDPKMLLKNLFSKRVFLKIDPQARFRGRGFGGVKCCRFLGAHLIQSYFARFVAGRNFEDLGGPLNPPYKIQ